MKPRDLKALVMHVSTNCDQACVHCSIWKANGKAPEALGREERLALIAEARSLGASAILFTGGEPLLCDHLEALARSAHGLGLSVQIATNGLGLEAARSWLASVVDEVYVSVEGPEAIHDSIRGRSMFSRLRASIASLRALPARPRLIGRSVVSNLNLTVLDDTVAAARDLGLDRISFLAADSASEAFGGDPGSRGFLRPAEAGVAGMLAAVSRLEALGELGDFVIEDARKLTWMAAGFLSRADPRRPPACNAPEWSSVVEADGALRPCFFQAKVSKVGRGVSLGFARASSAYGDALRELGPGNAICAACVCPKHVAHGAGAIRERVGAVLARAIAASSRRPGIPA